CSIEPWNIRRPRRRPGDRRRRSPASDQEVRMEQQPTRDRGDAVATPDPDVLRAEVRDKYRQVALTPGATYHFHTGRFLAARLGAAAACVDAVPGRAAGSVAGVANPVALRDLQPGEHVGDVGSGAGVDSIVAAGLVGSEGHVLGVDMTAHMLDKARAN